MGGAISEGISRSAGEAICIMMSDLSDSTNDLEKYSLPNNEQVTAETMNSDTDVTSLGLVDEKGEELILFNVFNFFNRFNKC